MVIAGAPALFLSLALTSPLTGAQPAQAPAVHESAPSLSGVVLDGADARIAGATIAVRSEDGAFERLAESTANGEFSIPHLPAGRYRVTVVARGFAPASTTFDAAAGLRLPPIRLAPAPVVEAVTVVSASRQDELRESLSTRVDVITRRQLEESGSETVAEALRDLPGVVVRRGSETAGPAGEQIQGIDSRQVLVLLDGQPLTGARGVKRGGILNLDRQSTGRLERVEVVKGASSALYGSDAIGGVINLITKLPARPLELAGRIAGGSAGAFDARAELGFLRSGASGLFTVERHQHDGFDLTPTTFDTTGAAFERHDLLAKGRVQLSDAVGLNGIANGHTNRSTGRSNGELGPQEDEIDESTLNAGVTADWQLAPAATLQARAYYAGYDEDSTGRLAPPRSTPLDPGALDERYQKADASLSWAGTHQHVQAGVEWSRDEYAGINRLRDASGESATTGVVWAQHRFAVHDRLTTTVGLRVDAHSRFGTAVSPKAAAHARLTDQVSVRAAYGRGFRAPDLGQLYYRFLNPTNFYQVIGNPNLEPEYADSIQIGSEFLSRARRLRFGVNLFHNDVRDLIESQSLGFVATPAQLQAVLSAERLDPSFQPVLGRLLLTYKNLHDAVTKGVEVDGEAAVTKGLSVGGAYTYLDAIDEETGQTLTGRHRHQGNLRIVWGHEGIGLRANLRGAFYSSWVAARTTAGGVTTDTTAPGFALWDAYVSQRLLRHFSIFAAVDNLADNQDPGTDVLGPNGVPQAIYRPEIGRTLRAGVNWSWSR